jgi:phospholipase/lecithinase/hemolysin
VHHPYRYLLSVCLSSAVMLLAIAILIPSTAAQPFSQLVVFGDSLSDVGNTAAASLDTFPGQYYYDDRFSNGPVFVEALSTSLGLGATVRSTAGGNNFAYGGSQTSGTGGLAGLVIRDIDEQVDQYLATRTLDPGALFLVFAGSNDLVSGQTNVHVPVNNLSEDISRLIAAGARNFLVPNLPLLGHTPRFNDDPTKLAQYNARSEQFNTALASALNNFEATDLQLEFFRLDVAALFNEALANPAAFGLTNVMDAAAPGLEPGDSSYNTSQVAPNAQEYVFWDDLHPTATVHAHLAEQALQLFEVPGDFNHDLVVDAADYVVWRNTLGRMGAGLAADGNGNGTIDFGDYDVWRAHFGGAPSKEWSAESTSILASAGSTRATVPESTSLLLLMGGGILLYFYFHNRGACRHRPEGSGTFHQTGAT